MWYCTQVFGHRHSLSREAESRPQHRQEKSYPAFSDSTGFVLLKSYSRHLRLDLAEQSLEPVSHERLALWGFLPVSNLLALPNLSRLPISHTTLTFMLLSSQIRLCALLFQRGSDVTLATACALSSFILWISARFSAASFFCSSALDAIKALKPYFFFLLFATAAAFWSALARSCSCSCSCSCGCCCCCCGSASSSSLGNGRVSASSLASAASESPFSSWVLVLCFNLRYLATFLSHFF